MVCHANGTAVMMWREFRPKRTWGAVTKYEELHNKGTVEKMKKKIKIRRRKTEGGKQKICFLNR